MDVLDRQTLQALATRHDWPSVSIYLPTHRTRSDKEQDRIRLKNLHRQALSQLVEAGMREPDAEALLAEVSATLADATFWREFAADGLAVFVREGETVRQTVDAPLPEQVVVGDRFYLRPVLNAFNGGEAFFALALDKNRTRLFTGDAAGIAEVDLADTPVSLAEIAKYDEREESLQYATFPGQAAKAGAGRGVSVFHGHGGEKDVDKDQATRFLRAVEKGVSHAIGDGSAPLVLFGVDYLVAIYREINTYPGVVPQQVIGATDELAPHEVHARALEALVPHYEQRIAADLVELREKAGSSLVSDDPVDIVTAALSGRVKTLLFDDGVGPFGHLDPARASVELVCAGAPRYLRESQPAPDAGAGSECGWDLVDLAAAETLAHGGDVRAFSGESSPVKGVAAIYRY